MVNSGVRNPMAKTVFYMIFMVISPLREKLTMASLRENLIMMSGEKRKSLIKLMKSKKCKKD